MSNQADKTQPGEQPIEMNETDLEQVAGGDLSAAGATGGSAGTQDAMKRVLFGAAGVTGGLATPGVTKDPD